MTRIGIEEEFVLLDSATLVPIAISDDDRRTISDQPTSGRIMPEFLTCQLECATDPVATLAEADAQVRHLRGLIGALAGRHQAVAAASGSPFAATGSLGVARSAHYDVVSAHLAHLTRGHEVNGLHVHVEIPDEEERVRSLNRVRGWLPVLLALTGNSPFADGIDTRFASWRSVVIRRLPSSWTPPRFHDMDDYRAQTDRLIALGAIADRASVSWAARISDRFPTVELRVFDAQLFPEDTLFASALARALAANKEAPGSTLSADVLDESLWTAARYGLDARLLDPTTGEVTEARILAAALLELVGPVLDEFGDRSFVEDRLARIRRDGTGADRQRRAYASEGVAGLRQLYRNGVTPLVSAP